MLKLYLQETATTKLVPRDTLFDYLYTRRKDMLIQDVTPILVKRYLNPNTRKRTVFLRGKSGIGKSDVVKQTSNLLALRS